MTKSSVNDIIDDLLSSLGNALEPHIDEYLFVYNKKQKTIDLEPIEYSSDNTITIYVNEDRLVVSLTTPPNKNNNIYHRVLGKTGSMYDPSVDVVNDLLRILRSITTREIDT